MDATTQDTSTVHPELRRIAGAIPRLTFSRQTLPLWRFFEKLPAIRRAPRDIVIEDRFIRAFSGTDRLRVRLYHARSESARPADAPAPALIWFHGGGYIIGKPEQDDAACSAYVREGGVVVVSVDYRRAPEHPFPAALDDGYEALTWTAAHAAELGADPARIAVGGASAGGGLAAALAQLAYDRDKVPLRFQMLVYPMLDDMTTARTDLCTDGPCMWTPESNRFGWTSYLGRTPGDGAVPAYAVPARRPDLSGLPPAWVGVGTLDLFHAEDIAYARRLEACGVTCELVVVPGAFHAFDVAGPRLEVARDWRRSQITALRRYLSS